MRDKGGISGLDAVIRSGGGLLIAVAWLCGSALYASRAELAGSDPGLRHLALAAMAFVCASSGAAGAAFGRHLLDRVAVARPWGGGDIAYLRRDD